jgi:hypothetical protein
LDGGRESITKARHSDKVITSSIDIIELIFCELDASQWTVQMMGVNLTSIAAAWAAGAVNNCSFEPKQHDVVDLVVVTVCLHFYSGTVARNTRERRFNSHESQKV